MQPPLVVTLLMEEEALVKPNCPKAEVPPIKTVSPSVKCFNMSVVYSSWFMNLQVEPQGRCIGHQGSRPFARDLGDPSTPTASGSAVWRRMLSR